MNQQILDNYFNQNIKLYEDLMTGCSSFNEIELKTIIFGKNWTRYDWPVLIEVLCLELANCEAYKINGQIDMIKNSENCIVLYNDMIENIDNNDNLLKIMQNQTVLLSLIRTAKNAYDKCNLFSMNILKLVAHTIKQKPELWNMSWLKIKFKINHKFKKCHALKWSLDNIFTIDAFIEKYQ